MNAAVSSNSRYDKRRVMRIVTTIQKSLALILVISSLGNATSSAIAAEPDDLPMAFEVSQQIDALFQTAWDADDVEPAALADHAMFLRRASLDLTGTIPTVSEVREFLNDASPDKRARVISDMLSRPRHATHLSQVWRSVMLPRGTDTTTGSVFENWLQEQFREHRPYDQVVHENPHCHRFVRPAGCRTGGLLLRLAGEAGRTGRERDTDFSRRADSLRSVTIILSPIGVRKTSGGSPLSLRKSARRAESIRTASPAASTMSSETRPGIRRRTKSSHLRSWMKLFTHRSQA